AGHQASVRSFVAKAAICPPAQLEEVLILADALCRGESQPIPPTAPKTGEVTIAQLAKRWTSGELAAQYPDHVPKKKSASKDAGLIAKHIPPKGGDVLVGEFALEHAERVVNDYQGEASSRRLIGLLLNRLITIAVYPLKLIASNPIPKGFFRRPKG